MTGHEDDSSRRQSDGRPKQNTRKEESLSLSEELYKVARNSGATPLMAERRDSLDFATLQKMTSDELLAIASVEKIADASRLDRQELIFQV